MAALLHLLYVQQLGRRKLPFKAAPLPRVCIQRELGRLYGGLTMNRGTLGFAAYQPCTTNMDGMGLVCGHVGHLMLVVYSISRTSSQQKERFGKVP
eukprot:COSAG05_NODE_2433_length_3069_cov_10.899621_2_plen_96_part_00